MCYCSLCSNPMFWSINASNFECNYEAISAGPDKHRASLLTRKNDNRLKDLQNKKLKYFCVLNSKYSNILTIFYSCSVPWQLVSAKQYHQTNKTKQSPEWDIYFWHFTFNHTAAGWYGTLIPFAYNGDIKWFRIQEAMSNDAWFSMSENWRNMMYWCP